MIRTALIAILATAVVHAREFRYEPDWESIRSRYEVPEWFRDAKFGIFVIWGAFSVPAVGSEKYGKAIYQEGWERGGRSPWKYHREHYGDPSEFGYKDLFPLFQMEHYDATEWARLFRKAGARYVVPMADYHDGFSMYASRHTKWNVVNIGPKKDIMRLLAEAVRHEGMKFGISSHFALNRVYYPKSDPAWDTNDPANVDLYWKPVPRDSKPSQAFLDRWWNRTTDAIEQYQPDILWFDFGIDKPGFESVHAPILAYYYNKGLEWGKEVVFQGKNMNRTRFVNGRFVQDRSVKSFPEDLIVLDLERGRMSEINPRPWQTDTSIGKLSWGYITHEEYKESGYLIDELVDIVSKNGCLLLAIGPKADGTIAEPAREILLEMGDWLRLNGEAIYETRPWKIYGEGPTKVAAGHHSEHANPENVAADIRFTQKNGLLYATALAWPEDGRFVIKSLARGNPHEARPIRSVFFVSGGKPVEWEQTGEGLVIEVGETRPCEAAYVFRVRFAD